MTDYSESTDDQINRFVTIALGYVRDETLEHEWYYDPKGESHENDNRGPLRRLKNYCNDWAAIGPIIENYGIDLELFGCPQWWAREAPNAQSEWADKNPKRAAAICFLMMQDAKG